MIGSTILHYKVLARIGQGGMGEVWVAEDTKLGRKVALKTLPPDLANDPDRRARFEREARAIDDGFRPGSKPFLLDPTVDSLRDDPRFIAMVNEITADVDRMRRALAAEPK
jgi:serine/threonine protein kinase